MKIVAQFRSHRKKISMIVVISIALIGSVILLNLWKGIPFSDLTRDITAIAEVPPYVGFFSQIGFFFWIATATLCLFSASTAPNKDKKIKSFLSLSGLFTLLLGFDDMFLLHEQVFPYLFGITEKVVFGIYGILVLLFLLKFYSILLQTPYILLLLAFFFLGLSIFMDVVPIQGLDPSLYENGAKMIGIVSWFFYFYTTAAIAVRPEKI